MSIGKALRKDGGEPGNAAGSRSGLTKMVAGGSQRGATI